MAKTFINDNGSPVNILDYIKSNISPKYNLSSQVLDAADFDTPQHRKRLITLLSRVNKWEHPNPLEHRISVRQAIGHLPSIESGQDSKIPWHQGKKHNKEHIEWMKHTPTNKTAFDNPIHYPKTIDKVSGESRPIKGFKTTYKRISWDSPSPTITMCNGAISSQNNVHPGKKKPNGTYSDARVLSVRELSLLMGLPENWLDKHKDQDEEFIRKVLGEAFPPKLSYHIIKEISD
jgi:DNA (cytosine-5)-methyltransferase 1